MVAGAEFPACSSEPPRTTVGGSYGASVNIRRKDGLRIHHHISGPGLIPACNTLPVACGWLCVHRANPTFYKHLRSLQGAALGVMWSNPRASEGLQAVTYAAESSMFLHRAVACPSTPPLM